MFLTTSQVKSCRDSDVQHPYGPYGALPYAGGVGITMTMFWTREKRVFLFFALRICMSQGQEGTRLKKARLKTKKIPIPRGVCPSPPPVPSHAGCGLALIKTPYPTAPTRFPFGFENKKNNDFFVERPRQSCPPKTISARVTSGPTLTHERTRDSSRHTRRHRALTLSYLRPFIRQRTQIKEISLFASFFFFKKTNREGTSKV